MAKISSPNGEYPVKQNPEGGDKVIGTDVSNDNATKNFTVQGIADFATDPNNVDIVNSVTGTTPVQVTPGSGDVNVSLQAVYPQPPGTITYADVTLDQYGRVINFSQNTPVESASAPDSGGGTATLTGDITFVSGTNTIITGDATNNTITIESTPAATGPGGTVTQILTSGGLTGGPISTTGTVSMEDLSAAPVNLVPGTYDNAQVTVDEYGRVTAVSVGSGQPDQGLQSVLNVDDTALNSQVVLNGAASAFLAPDGSLGVQDANVTNLATINRATIQDYIKIEHELQDSAGNTGSQGDILISDPTYNGGAGGVLWTNQPVQAARVSILAAELSTLSNTVGIEIVPATAGGAISVISATFGYSYNSAVYTFSNDLALFCGLPSLSVNPQYTVPASIINGSGNRAVNMDAAPAGRLLTSQPLELYTTGGGTSTVGDGTVIIEVVYRVVSI